MLINAIPYDSSRSDAENMDAITLHIAAALRASLEMPLEAVKLIIGFCPLCIERDSYILALASTLAEHYPNKSKEEVLAQFTRQFERAFDFIQAERAARTSAEQQASDLASAPAASSSKH